MESSIRITEQGGRAYEVNRRSVIASQKSGHAGLQKFCADMDRSPPSTKKAYNDHLKRIEKMALSDTEEIMCKSAERLRDITARETPENIYTTEDGTVLADVAVSVDGTWQKRGHSSKIGVVFVISIKTGEILDHAVKSLFCQECSSHNNMDKDSEYYKL